MDITIHTLHVHLHGSDSQLDRIERGINHLLKQGTTMTQLVDDVVAGIKAVAKGVDDLEAKVTAILANSGMSQADKDALTQAVADLRAIAADAADGVDEAAVTPAP